MTDRGRPVAILAPLPDGGAWERLARAGEITAAHKDAADVQAPPSRGRSASQVLADLRADEW